MVGVGGDRNGLGGGSAVGNEGLGTDRVYPVNPGIADETQVHRSRTTEFNDEVIGAHRGVEDIPRGEGGVG